MTRFAAPVMGLLLSAAAAQQPTFRATTEMVRIDTLVLRENRPVAGLTSADFEVLDNGVPQRIVTLRQMAEVAVGVGLDASGSMAGVRIDHATAATLALLGQLHAGERSVVVAFGQQSSMVIPPGTPFDRAATSLKSIRPAGWTALSDGAYTAVIASDTGPGSKLLVLLTDGRNNASWTQAQTVIDTARRREVVIYAVGVDLTKSGMVLGGPRQPIISVNDSANGRTLADSTAASYRVVEDDTRKFLEILARDTGGRALDVKWTDDLSAVFRGILDEYRQRYILAFAPEGVTRSDGWHTLEVKLVRGSKGTIHARAGYWAK